MVKKFDEYFSINEEFMGIDFDRIKSEAYKFAQTKECIYVLSEIDPSILDKIIIELGQKLSKYKNNIDLFLKKAISSLSLKNEGILSTIILTTFGIHASLKALEAIRKNWSLGRYLIKVFADGNYNNELKTVRDVIISLSFIFLIIARLVGGNSIVDHNYFSPMTNSHVCIPFKWNGFHDYKYFDSFNKEYDVKRVSYGFFEIYYKNRLIGYEDDGKILNIAKKEILFYSQYKSEFGTGEIDLEKELRATNLNLKSKKEIDNRLKKKEFLSKERDEKNAEIDRLSHEIDSIRGNLYENLDQAKSIIRKAGLNYEEYKNNESFSKLKNLLQEDNKIGYLGLFTNFLINEKKPFSDIEKLYTKIKESEDIIDKLRDATTGELKNVVDFDKYEYLYDAVSNLDKWKIVNQFIRQLPPTQKNLIWEDGWFKGDLKDQSTYLTNAFIKIVKDDHLSKLFFRKISSIKDKKSLIEAISRTINEEPWNYDYWYEKLSSMRNVIITWSSKEDNQIICAVFTHPAIQKIAYMTSWCIVRGVRWFNDYFSRGNQFVLYDFNKSNTSNLSVIGFTADSRGITIACHDKSDKGIRLPNKFKNNKHLVDKKFINIKARTMIEKVDIGLLKILKRKLKDLLDIGPLSTIIDWYND